MATTIRVKNIGAQTSDSEIKDFFSFCGKITSIDITKEESTKSATVVFEKDTAARTALLLNHTNLGGNEITVEGEGNLSTTPPPEQEPTTGEATTAERTGSPVLSQEEKPPSRILAEVLAHGYLVAEQGLQKALAIDEQHGLSARFVTTLRKLDERTQATERAKSADESYGLTRKAGSLLTGLGSYFEKAKDTPTGKRIVAFYTARQRQVQDIHNEARRLAELKKEETGGDLVKGLGLDKVGLDKVLGRFGGGQAQGQEGKKEGESATAPAEAAPATEAKEKPAASS